jgi:hypothetical protein
MFCVCYEPTVMAMTKSSGNRTKTSSANNVHLNHLFIDFSLGASDVGTQNDLIKPRANDAP